MFTNAKGGIIDDCIVTRTGQESFYIVANAGRADVDLNHIGVSIMKFKIKFFCGFSNEVSKLFQMTVVKGVTA